MTGAMPFLGPASNHILQLRITVHPLEFNFFTTTNFTSPLTYLQMALGIAAVSQAYFLMRSGTPCNTTFFHLYVSFAIYGSYFLLFGHFFYKSYMGRSRKSALNGVKKIE